MPSRLKTLHQRIFRIRRELCEISQIIYEISRAETLVQLHQADVHVIDGVNYLGMAQNIVEQVARLYGSDALITSQEDQS